MAYRDGTSGSLHEDTLAGRIESLYGLQAYISEPSNGAQPKGIVVHCSGYI